MGSIPNSLRLLRGLPNPRGMLGAELFLFTGNATLPIDEINFEAELPGRLPPRDFRLRVLHINDLHGHFAHVTTCESTPIFSRIVSHLQATRRADDANSATLFLSAGDDLVGTPFEELLSSELLPQRFNPAYRFLSQAGLDADTIGNHEFDLGTHLLGDSIRADTRFPILCANLVHCARLDSAIFPAALFIVKGIRIGIIGFTTAAEVVHLDDANFEIVHPVSVAQNIVPAIRPLCDVLILLTHLGHSLNATTTVTCDAGDFELAASLPPGVCDLIVGGHSHVALNPHSMEASNIVNGIPIVQAGAFGQWLGEVELVLRPQPTLVEAHLLAVDDLPVDPAFETDHIRPFAEQVGALLSEELGSVGEIETRTADFASRESEMANFIADAMVERCHLAGLTVDFAMIDSSAIACDLESGMLTFENWFQLMPHADVIQLYQIRCDQLADLLGDNARRIFFADDTGFAQFSRDLRYAIHRGPSPEETLASDVLVHGIPLDEQRGRTFSIACPSFTRQRDAAWNMRAEKNQWRVVLMRDLPRKDTPLRVRDELLAYIRAHRGVIARRDGRVRFLDRQNLSAS